MLSLQVLGNEEPGIIRNLEKIAGVLEKRVIAERAASREGLVLNSIYSAINDGATIMQEGLAWMVVRIWVKDDKEIQAPTTSKSISDSFGKIFSPTEIGRIWRGLGQDIKQQMRHDGKRYKGVLLITDPERLDFEFKKYVPDAVDVLEDVSLQKGIDSFSSPQPETISPATNPTLPVESVPRDPEETDKIAESLKNWENSVQYHPLQIQDKHKFLLWFTQNVDSTIPAGMVWARIEQIKGFTSGSIESKKASDKSCGSIRIKDQEYQVELGDL